LLTIYYVPGTRAIRPVWLCEELGIPYKREEISFEAEFRSSPEWRSINPVGKVPAMHDGDLTLFESCAMVQVILDRYGDGQLEPEKGSDDHALMQQWSWFAESTLARPGGEIVNHHRVFGEEIMPKAIAEMEGRVRLCLESLDDWMAGREFLIDFGFSTADINMGYSLLLADRHVAPYDDLSHVWSYYQRLASRPAFQKVIN
jgi:glutathione S-transferase